jgi:hypothetical protein
VIADGAPQAAVPAARGRNLRTLGSAAAVALPLTVIAARNGGYFPTVWGWAALALGWALLVVAVVVRELAVTRASMLFAASVGVLAVWTLLSTTWSDSTAASALEAERALVYVIATATLAIVASLSGAAVVLGAVSAATFLASAYGLATRLFPERIGTFDPVSGYRLAAPVGYWNAMASLLQRARCSRSASLLTDAVSTRVRRPPRRSSSTCR